MRRLKDWVEGLAHRPSPLYALFILAMVEAIIFPIPPDVLLIALCVGLPAFSLRYALVCTAGSLFGAGFGYALGYFLWYSTGTSGALVFSDVALFFFDHIPGFTQERFEQVGALYSHYDFWSVFIAGFTPIPFKVVTVTAGVFNLNVPTFAVGAILSRSLRFFLVAGLFYAFGPTIKRFIDRYLELLTILFVVLLVGGFVVIKYVF